MNPLLPILLLLLGAVGSLAGLLRDFRYTGLVAAAATLLAFLSTLFLGFRLPAEVTLSHWGPDTLFPAGLRLLVDGPSWLLALALVVAALAVFLTGITRGGGRRILPRAASLVVAATALTALFADSLVTLAISWAALDAVSFTTLVLLTSRQREAPGGRIASQAMIGLGLNVLATVLAIAAALEAEHAGSAGLLSSDPLPERAITFLILAAVFRLNVFPFHQGLPAEAQLRQGVGAILRLAPMVVGVEVLALVVLREPEIPFHTWLTAGAVVAVLLGAGQWWSTSDPRRGIAYVVLAHAGLVLLAALWGGRWAAAGVVAQGLTLVVGGASLFLYNGYYAGQRGWVVAPILAAAILSGLPLTAGFIGLWIIYVGLAEGAVWLGLLIVVLAQILLAAGYLRLAFWPGEPLPSGEPIVGVAYLFGLGLPLVFGVLTGLAPAALGRSIGVAPMPGLLGLLSPTGFIALGGALLAVILGFVLWYFEANTRAVVESAWGAMVAARLDWLYASLWDLYRLLRRLLRVAAAILEGEGGVLWTLVLALLVWLAFGR